MNFDPTAFMNATIEEVLETKREILPVREYHGIITKLEPKSGTISKGTRAGETWAGLKISVELDIPEDVKQATGREKGTANSMVMLDLNEMGGLDRSKGKNIALGKWFEATGLNVAGQAKSPMMLEGRSVVVSLGHRVDPSDSSKIYEDINGVRKA